MPGKITRTQHVEKSGKTGLADFRQMARAGIGQYEKEMIYAGRPRCVLTKKRPPAGVKQDPPAGSMKTIHGLYRAGSKRCAFNSCFSVQISKKGTAGRRRAKPAGGILREISMKNPQLPIHRARLTICAHPSRREAYRAPHRLHPTV